ncbi:Methionyl-tRNA formyltransferase [Halomonadaceae bacterium LMG 33818]|uniref:methionyl-tRNA formyltransferase n=1 Tax=Cernens ardua TaxID=3402176 RepID=UPI003EDC7BEC
MASSLRVGFAGTPEFAATILQSILDSRHEVVCVYTQPDRPAGRGRKPQPSAVKELALTHDLPLYQPERLRSDESRSGMKKAQLDVLVVAAYGLILPGEVLAIPPFGALNVHASLLPRWRGAAPIQRAIEAMDSESGVTIMAMDEGLDTGAMLLKRSVGIDDTTTGGSLHDALSVLGAEAIVTVLDQLADTPSALDPVPQPEHGVTYAEKLSKAEAQLDFRQDALHLAAKIRAFNPWPVAWTSLNGDTLRLWEAKALDARHDAPPGTLLAVSAEHLHIACGEGILAVFRAQMPGTKALSIRELLSSPKRAEKLKEGALFDSSESAQ